MDNLDTIPALDNATPHDSPVSIPEQATRTPPRNPAATPSKRKDKRPTLTLKGDEFDAEFRALVNKAAERSGQTQAAFVSSTLTREAQRVLKGIPLGTPDDTPAATPPALAAERLDEQDRRLAAMAGQLDALAAIAAQVQALTELQRRSFWHRLRALLAPVVPVVAD